MAAKELLNEAHPLNKTFRKWLGDKPATKRQARKFLQAFPQFRTPQEA